MCFTLCDDRITCLWPVCRVFFEHVNALVHFRTNQKASSGACGYTSGLVYCFLIKPRFKAYLLYIDTMSTIEINKVYIVGLGAMGTMYASKLYDHDPHSVKVIADKARIVRYEKEAVCVNGREYKFDFIAPGDAQDPADLILVAVKHLQLPEAIAYIQPFVGKDTIVMSLLNGISSEQIIGAAIGKQHLLYAYGLKMDALRKGREVFYAHMGYIVFGEIDNRSTPRLAAVKTLFEKAGIPSIVPDDILFALWNKFMLNVSVNQVSALLSAPFAVFGENADARELLALVAREVVAIAAEEGIALHEGHIPPMLDIIIGLNPDGKTSMLQDIEAQRPTELDIFAGEVIRLGEKHGVPTPLNQMLFHAIRYMESLY